MVPEVWVPPVEVRELRALVAHRQRLIRQRTQAPGTLWVRLHSILATYHILPPEGDPFSGINRGWWEALKVSSSARLLLEQQLAILQNLNPLIAQIESELVQLSSTERWHRWAGLLIQLEGIGVLTTMTVMSAIGERVPSGCRFPSAKDLVGYSGTQRVPGAGVYASGEVVRGGGITKQGGSASLRLAFLAIEPHIRPKR